MDDLPSLASLLITARGSLSIAEVARLVGCSRRAIYFYEVDGKLPKIGTLNDLVRAMNPDKELIRRIYAAHKRDAVARNLARAAKRKGAS
ncbi:hypothetical protein LBMAG42_57170 [Deltaproteobacteria bacterium]|nr:hypothetical protein LBMAG42_57170 [Deltaproteobacteria bacterium]